MAIFKKGEFIKQIENMISKNIMKIVANVNPTNRSLVRKFIISKGKTFELERQIQFEFCRSYNPGFKAPGFKE